MKSCRFQSHNGAIAALLTDMYPEVYETCFNPTMVRLLQLPDCQTIDCCIRFNPTMVRLLLAANPVPTLLQGRFNPTMVRLLLN